MDQQDKKEQQTADQQDKTEQETALNNLKILINILKVYKRYKVPQDLQNDDLQNKTFVVFLGVTGVGKSSIINSLRGAQMKVTSKSTKIYLEVVTEQLQKDDAKKQENNANHQKFKIGNLGTSETMEPEHIAILHKDQEMILVDTPGYASTNIGHFTKQEQQWLDSLKMRKYFKNCRKCILLLIMQESTLTERDRQFDYKEFLNYIQNFTGNSDPNKLIQKLRIIFNKSELEDNEQEKKEFIEYLIEELTNQQEKQQKHQDLQQIEKTQNINGLGESNPIQNLSYFIEILKRKNNKCSYEFHVVKQLKKKDKQFASEQKKEELLDFIQSLEPLEMSLQPCYKNKDTLKLYLNNIKTTLYQKQIDEFFHRLNSATDFIKTFNKEIAETDYLKKQKECFKSKEDKSKVVCYEELDKNPKFKIIYKIIESLIECHQELWFNEYKLEQSIAIEQKPKSEIQKVSQKKRIKQFSKTKLISLIELINEFQGKSYDCKDLIQYYRIIRKFAVPDQRFINEELITYQKKMLLIDQIKNKLKEQIEKVAKPKNKLDNLVFGMELQIQFEIENYAESIQQTIEIIRTLIKKSQDTYSFIFQFIEQQENLLEEFIKYDQDKRLFIMDKWERNSENYNSINKMIKFVYDWQEKKSYFVCDAFKASKKTIIDKDLNEIRLYNKKNKNTQLMEIILIFCWHYQILIFQKEHLIDFIIFYRKQKCMTIVTKIVQMLYNLQKIIVFQVYLVAQIFQGLKVNIQKNIINQLNKNQRSERESLK